MGPPGHGKPEAVPQPHMQTYKLGDIRGWALWQRRLHPCHCGPGCWQQGAKGKIPAKRTSTLSCETQGADVAS